VLNATFYSPVQLPQLACTGEGLGGWAGETALAELLGTEARGPLVDELQLFNNYLRTRYMTSGLTM
jgi:hypothetical protein